MQDFSSAKTYTVTAEDGSTQDYTVTVTLATNSAAEITGFSIDGVHGVISGTEIDLIVPYETNLNSLSPTISLSGGATVNPGSGAPTNFSSGPVTYRVTAEDGTATKDYAVRVDGGWYVASAGDDTAGTGTRARPLATVQKALEKMAATYAAAWPGKGSPAEASGAIIIMDVVEVGQQIDINDTGGIYPPIVLRDDPSSPGGTLQALAGIGATKAIVWISDAAVTLTGGLILQGTNNLMDNIRGVYVASGGFTMSGGTISGNTASGDGGGGVYMMSGGTFTMSGGTISNNAANIDGGGGVYIERGAYMLDGTFTMTGGTISNNTAGRVGGGVYVESLSTDRFSKTGGTIYGSNDDSNKNTATSGALYGGWSDANYIFGHAIFIGPHNSTSAKRKDTTVGPADTLYCNDLVEGTVW
ncbi:MAG: DUF5018 domain-containing protein [Spirochaetaceae bacterium]|nr:DUF5018 domain-containing protein [Spirochaetaceae bacterium]